MNSFKRWGIATAGTLVAALALSACGGGSGTPADSSSPAASSDTAAAPAELTFWGWAPGYADSVKAFNASQSEVVVKFEEIQPGSRGGYEKMLNAVQAGNAACLGQVGYETLTSFAAQGALEDVSSFANANQSEYVDFAWNSVKVGDAVYGAPVDTGPMALFYNKELFEKHKIEIPTTWDEYKVAAEKLHAADPKIKISSPYANYDYAGLSWQAGAPWFNIEADSWKVSIDSDENKKVADYWQSLVEADTIAAAPMYDPAWFKGLGDGSIATVVGAVWQAGVIKGDAADGKGKWAVAPMPQWDAANPSVGNVGGSATAVLKGCKTPEAAWKFANFLSTDADSYGNLVEKGALYPAAKALLELPQLTKEDAYFSNQKIFDVFKDEALKVNPDWTWGPNMPLTTTKLDDELNKAWAGNGKLADALTVSKKATVEDMTSQGISVAE